MWNTLSTAIMDFNSNLLYSRYDKTLIGHFKDLVILPKNQKEEFIKIVVLIIQYVHLKRSLPTIKGKLIISVRKFKYQHVDIPGVLVDLINQKKVITLDTPPIFPYVANSNLLLSVTQLLLLNEERDDDRDLSFEAIEKKWNESKLSIKDLNDWDFSQYLNYFYNGFREWSIDNKKKIINSYIWLVNKIMRYKTPSWTALFDKLDLQSYYKKNDFKFKVGESSQYYVKFDESLKIDTIDASKYFVMIYKQRDFKVYRDIQIKGFNIVGLILYYRNVSTYEVELQYMKWYRPKIGAKNLESLATWTERAILNKSTTSWTKFLNENGFPTIVMYKRK